MPIGLEVTASNISAFLMNIAPTITVILVVLGGIIYGLSYTQPPDSRGKWHAGVERRKASRTRQLGIS